jgi:hypothetical protein
MSAVTFTEMYETVEDANYELERSQQMVNSPTCPTSACWHCIYFFEMNFHINSVLFLLELFLMTFCYLTYLRDRIR